MLYRSSYQLPQLAYIFSKFSGLGPKSPLVARFYKCDQIVLTDNRNPPGSSTRAILRATEELKIRPIRLPQVTTQFRQYDGFKKHCRPPILYQTCLMADGPMGWLPVTAFWPHIPKFRGVYGLGPGPGACNF